MKLTIHSLLMVSIIVVFITVFSLPVWGTDVGGIIYTDTTWDLAGSPYNIPRGKIGGRVLNRKIGGRVLISD